MKKKHHFGLIFFLIITLIIFTSNDNQEDNNSTKNSLPIKNAENTKISTPTKKASSSSTAKPIITVTLVPTSTPTKEPIYIVYNSKDINGAPFYAKPNRTPDSLIRSLHNETQIEILGEIESHNNYDWYPIRDDRGREGWIQAIFITDLSHTLIKPSSIKNSIPTKTVTPTKKPIPTKTPIPTRKPAPTPFRIIWECYDNTSFDGNAYNDNICYSNTGATKLVSDSEAIRLDPSYWPGKSGAPYYNNK